MLNPKQFEQNVLAPTLGLLAQEMMRPQIVDKASRRLMLLTALAESRLEYLVQLGDGPALGLFQMEPATHDWLRFDFAERSGIAAMLGSYGTHAQHMIAGLDYAVMMARLRYWVVPARLPHKDNGMGMAQYHKDHYNTYLGSAVPEKTAKWWPVVLETVP